jgi:hypothetical protein
VALLCKTCSWHQADTDRFTRETGSPQTSSRHPKPRKHAQRRGLLGETGGGEVLGGEARIPQGVRDFLTPSPPLHEGIIPHSLTADTPTTPSFFAHRQRHGGPCFWRSVKRCAARRWSTACWKQRWTWPPRKRCTWILHPTPSSPGAVCAVGAHGRVQAWRLELCSPWWAYRPSAQWRRTTFFIALWRMRCYADCGARTLAFALAACYKRALYKLGKVFRAAP